MTTYNVLNRGSMASGQIEDVSQILANLDAIAAVLNGHIDAANLAAGKIIDPAKLLQVGAALGAGLRWDGANWSPGTLAQYNVKDYGAVGDGVADDTLKIQAAIDEAAAAGGGHVFLPDGVYRCNVVLDQHVSIGGNRGRIPNWQGSSVVLKQAAAGAVIDTPATAVSDIGISNLMIEGIGAGTPGKAIYIRNAYYAHIFDVGISDFADEGIRWDTGWGGILRNIIAIRCVLNRVRAGVTGVIHLDGTDHWLQNIEASASSNIEGAISSANLYVAAVALVGHNTALSGVIGEISDVGFYVTGSLHKFVNCRADKNYGHGFFFRGASPYHSMLTNCLGYDSSQGANNTYDNFHFETEALLNLITNCKSLGDGAILHRYGFYDDAQTATQKNVYANIIDSGAVTGGYRVSNNSGSIMWTVPIGSSGDNGDASKTLTARSSAETQYWFSPLTAPRTVTLSAVGAYNGAKFKIVRMANSTGASTLSVGGLKFLATGQWAEVTFDGNTWYLSGFGSL